MPATLNFLERLFMITVNKGPAPLLDIMGGISIFVVHTALELDLFEALTQGPRSSQELADELGCDQRGMPILLEVLVSLGYVEQRGERFANSAMTKKWMMGDSEMRLRDGFMYYAPLIAEMMPALKDTLNRGSPRLHFYDWLAKNPAHGKHYQDFMTNLARLAIPDLLRRIDLGPAPRRLLDLGGGHGLYSIALCHKYPELEATIVDSPYSRPWAEANIEAEGVSGRVTFVEGDYHSDHLDTGFDAALLFNVMHQETAEANQALIVRAAEALAAGGRLVVMDELHEHKRINVQNYIKRMFSLIFYHTVGGQTYTLAAIRAWQETAGLTDIRRADLGGTGLSLVTGTRPAGA